MKILGCNYCSSLRELKIRENWSSPTYSSDSYNTSSPERIYTATCPECGKKWGPTNSKLQLENLIKQKIIEPSFKCSCGSDTFDIIRYFTSNMSLDLIKKFPHKEIPWQRPVESCTFKAVCSNCLNEWNSTNSMFELEEIMQRDGVLK